jgi:GT2 family glycosyltransferase
MSMIKIFLVILNWNRAADTIDCLESISKARISGFVLQVVVVDNASSDNSVRKIKDAIFKIKVEGLALNVISNEKNMGFAAGNNVGIQYALGKGADYVVVLNNDTLVHPDLLIKILGVARQDKLLGAASPKIYFARGFEFYKDRYKNKDLGKVIWYAGGEIDWKNVYGKGRGVDEIDKGQYDEVAECDYATGTCMFIPRRVFEKVGYFDERYYMYYEDTDLSQRIKRAGFKTIYVPNAVIWHKVAQSSAIGSDLNDYYISRNRLIFGIKYAPLRAKISLIRQSMRFLLRGRKWQKAGVLDFYLRNYGRGSFKSS